MSGDTPAPKSAPTPERVPGGTPDTHLARLRVVLFADDVEIASTSSPATWAAAMSRILAEHTGEDSP
jgi:hypothetical protein